MIGNYFFQINTIVKDGGTYLNKTWEEIANAMQAGVLCYVYNETNARDIFNIQYSIVESVEYSDNVYSVVVFSTGSSQGGGYFECENKNEFPKVIPHEP